MEEFEPTSLKDEIFTALETKATLKQQIYRQGKEIFSELKLILKEIVEELEERMEVVDDSVELNFKETNELEAEIKFGGEVLVFSLHTNVFTFEKTHEISNLPYVQEDPSRAFVNVIQIHNFLADSIKFNRMRDLGYLVARLFINKDKHFFVEGSRQLGFLYNDFSNMVMNKVYLRAIAESAILFSMDFDLYVPPYDKVKEITVQQRLADHITSQQITAKRLGFRFNGEEE